MIAHASGFGGFHNLSTNMHPCVNSSNGQVQKSAYFFCQATTACSYNEVPICRRRDPRGFCIHWCCRRTDCLNTRRACRRFHSRRRRCVPRHSVRCPSHWRQSLPTTATCFEMDFNAPGHRFCAIVLAARSSRYQHVRTDAPGVGHDQRHLRQRGLLVCQRLRAVCCPRRHC